MIEFHGDSTQAGITVWGTTTHENTHTPAKLVGQILDVETVNLGVGGSTLNDALTGTIYPGGLNFAQHIAQSSAQIIVANWGINDAYQPGVTAANHAARWQQVSDICAAAGKTFVLETASPIGVSHNSILSNLVAASKTITGAHIADINVAVSQWYPQWQAHLDTPKIHPNGIMYAWIGCTMADMLAGHI
jgi:hypothetical protein